MCNVIPIFSPFFLYHPHSLIKRIFFYFLVSLLFLCMHAYIKSSGFIGGKGPRSLKKIAILPDNNGNVGLHVCAKFCNHK